MKKYGITIIIVLLIYTVAVATSYRLGYQRGIERATYNCNEVSSALLEDLRDCQRGGYSGFNRGL